VDNKRYLFEEWAMQRRNFLVTTLGAGFAVAVQPVMAQTTIVFGSSLNEHVHFHCCVIDGVFEPTAVTGDTDAAPGLVFHAVPKRLRYFLQRGRRSQWLLYFGKPTLVIESPPNIIGIVLIDITEFRMAGCSLERPVAWIFKISGVNDSSRLSTATQNSVVPIKAMPMQCRETSMASIGLLMQNGH
jgi:hypothetical protein